MNYIHKKNDGRLYNEDKQIEVPFCRNYTLSDDFIYILTNESVIKMNKEHVVIKQVNLDAYIIKWKNGELHVSDRKSLLIFDDDLNLKRCIILK